jgi:hypothetical protein
MRSMSTPDAPPWVRQGSPPLSVSSRWFHSSLSATAPIRAVAHPDFPGGPPALEARVGDRRLVAIPLPGQPRADGLHRLGPRGGIAMIGRTARSDRSLTSPSREPDRAVRPPSHRSPCELPLGLLLRKTSIVSPSPNGSAS